MSNIPKIDLLSLQDRRLVYLYAMPAAILTCLLGEVLILLGLHHSNFDAVGFPFLIVFFSFQFILFYRSTSYFSVAELSLLSGIFLYLTASLAYALTYPLNVNVAGEIGANGLWSIAIHTMIFWIFGSRRGKRISTLYFVGAVLLTLSTYINSLIKGYGVNELFYLIQLYFSSFLYIIITATFTRNIEARGVQVKEMSAQAYTDTLTQLPNRRFLEMQLEQQRFLAEQQHKIFSLVILDIDHFKAINDTYGHQAGDNVLQQIGKLLTTHLRQGDFVGRWGGEEFLILLPSCNTNCAIEIMERIRKHVATYTFNLEISATFSCGISEWQSKTSIAEMLEHADDALYQAKRGGRNQTIAA